MDLQSWYRLAFYYRGTHAETVPRTCTDEKPPTALAIPEAALGQRVRCTAGRNEQIALWIRDSPLLLSKNATKFEDLLKNLSSNPTDVNGTVKVLTRTTTICSPKPTSADLHHRDTLTDLGPPSSTSSYCPSAFLLRLANVFIVLLALKSWAVCSFTMQNVPLPKSCL